jgi:beta-xylosidase
MRPIFAFFSAALCIAAASAAEIQPFVPVLSEDFPDPFVLPQEGAFLAYATNPRGGVVNVQMARSTDLTDWSLLRDGDKLHDAMPVLPVWARAGLTWAPEVIRTDKGYVLHFTTRDRKSDLQCVGAAFATSPLGPFTSEASEPLVCQTELGGTIDADAFRDSDGQLYLYYKNDGNNPRFKRTTSIYAQRLTPDGLHLTGEAVAIASNDAKWEAHVIEAPSMVHHDDRYVLFYSANHYGWERDQTLSPYAMGYAVCNGPMGPCTDAPNNPILYSYRDPTLGCLSGPGHQAVFSAGARQYIAFHAWGFTGDCRNAHSGRFLYVAPLNWKAGVPQIGVSLRRPDAK